MRKWEQHIVATKKSDDEGVPDMQRGKAVYRVWM